jgi:hypothetical protein
MHGGNVKIIPACEIVNVSAHVYFVSKHSIDKCSDWSICDRKKRNSLAK